MENKACFILIPYSSAGELERPDLDYIYEHILKKAITDFKIASRSYFDIVERFDNKVGSIISGIVNKLNTAELVIADLTGLNPNVMYELGVRHSLRRGTIIITQNLNDLPSDLRDYLTVEYKYSKITIEQSIHFEKFKSDLHKTIAEITSTNKYDSPVLNYLQQRQRFRDEDEIQRLKTKAIIIGTIELLSAEIYSLITNLETTKKNEVDEELTTHLFNLKLSNLTTALNELDIPYDSTILYEKIVAVKTLLTEVSKLFYLQEYFTTSMGGIPDIPIGVLGKGITNKQLINKNILDLFHLMEKKTIRFTNMKELFEPQGRLEVELIKYLNDYIIKQANKLGFTNTEIEEIQNL